MSEQRVNAENCTKMEEFTTPWPSQHTALRAEWKNQTATIKHASVPLATGNPARNYTDRTVGG